MRPAYDVEIVGGAVIRSAVAYFLAANPDFDGSILVVERDPTYSRASTSLSAASIRVQFSNPINVQISQFGSAFINDFANVMQVKGEPPPDLNFHPGGYLFLANTPDGARTLRENHAIQRACGADVVPWGHEDLARAFPHLTVDDILLASYGQSGEGWFFLTGAPPADDPAVDWDDFEPRWEEFEDLIWPALATRSPAFEAIKVVNQWAGHYDFNTLDHNLIVGPHPEVANFLYANGFSGHGLQQGPATGRAVSELITYGEFRTLDLSVVGYERIVAGRPFLEKAVI